MRCGMWHSRIAARIWPRHLVTALWLFGLCPPSRCVLHCADTRRVCHLCNRDHHRPHACEAVQHLSWSPDDKRLLTCGSDNDNTVRLWGLDGTCQLVIDRHAMVNTGPSA
jgi:WD40 repeat protein